MLKCFESCYIIPTLFPYEFSKCNKAIQMFSLSSDKVMLMLSRARFATALALSISVD